MDKYFRCKPPFGKAVQIDDIETESGLVIITREMAQKTGVVILLNGEQYLLVESIAIECATQKLPPFCFKTGLPDPGNIVL